MKKLFLFMITSALALAPLYSQESLSASGGEASGAGGEASYSIGQLFYHDVSGADASITEGVQQPYEISTVTSISDPLEQDLALEVYPNPVNDILILEVKSNELQDLAFELYDASGKLIKKQNKENVQTAISMGGLKPGVYFLRVTNQNNVLQTFRIIKNQ